MARVPVNDKIVARAQELLKDPRHSSGYRNRLHDIVNGKVASVDVDWWRHENGVAARQVDARLEKKFKQKLAAIKALADPARNPSEHQRRVAEAAFAKLQAAGRPKEQRVPSAPGLEEYDREIERSRAQRRAEMDAAFKAYNARWAASPRGKATKAWMDAERARHAEAAVARVNTTRPEPKPEPINTTKANPSVNTTTKKPRSADRHREPNRDRHSPGYMRDYMRRRRAKGD